jgi:hypothetical protein
MAQNIILCPMGTCPRCDEERRVEREARCPMLPPKREGTIRDVLREFWRTVKLGLRTPRNF